MCPGWQHRRGRQSCFSKGCLLLGFPFGYHFFRVSQYGHCSHLLPEVLQKIEDISERGGKTLECEPKTLITVCSPFPSVSLSTAVLFPSTWELPSQGSGLQHMETQMEFQVLAPGPPLSYSPSPPAPQQPPQGKHQHGKKM